MKKEELKELLEFFNASDIAKLKISHGDFKVELEKNISSSLIQEPVVYQAVETTAIPQISSNEIASNDSANISSPMVGTFYQAPSPGARPFIQVGDTVKKGQTIAIIEAMKIMNEIEAEFDCKILKLLVSDGQPVEYDMPLFAVEII